MAAVSEVWEAHRRELYKKIIELDQEHIENLVTTLKEHHLIDQRFNDEKLEQETVEAVVDSAGRIVTSNPTALSSFLDIIKTFGMQPLADTIRRKVDLSGSSMIPGMLQHMPIGKGTPALSPLPPIPGSPTFSYMENDYSDAASDSNTQSGDAKGGMRPSLPSVHGSGKSSLTPGTGNMDYPPSNEASALNSTSLYLEHLDHGRTQIPVDGTNLQDIPSNDSGIILELSNSSGIETTNFGSTPPVQRSHSGTSDSSGDNVQLEEAPSPIRKKFEAMKVKIQGSKKEKQKLKKENQELKEVNQELEEEIQELKERNLGLELELQEKQVTPVTETLQPLAGQFSLQYTQKGGMEPQDDTSNASHSENEQVFKSTTTRSTLFSQEDMREIPHNTPAEVREYIQKLERERKFLMQKLTETEAERDALQAERDVLLKWIQTIISHYERMIYDRKSRYKKIHQQHQELASEIEEIATDSGMESRKRNVTVMLVEKAEQMNAEMIHIQELEQQRDEVVSGLLQKHLPSSGSHEFDSVFAYYLARNNMIFEGTKCKVCNQQLGIYCEHCLPDKKCTRQDHHEVDHAFKPLKVAASHIYSEAILLIACRGCDKDDSGPHEDILRGYLSKPKTITPGDCSWNLPECTRCDSSTSDLENEFKEHYKGQYSSSFETSSVDSDAVLFYIYIHRGLFCRISTKMSRKRRK